MESLLEARGYNPADADKLHAEGMGPFELIERLKGEGSLEYTHNLVKLPTK
jgi:hypothetical protein